MEHEPHSTPLANGHSQIAGEVHDYAAILVTTGRALDFQHQGSFSIPEGSYTRTCSQRSRDIAA